MVTDCIGAGSWNPLCTMHTALKLHFTLNHDNSKKMRYATMEILPSTIHRLFSAARTLVQAGSLSQLLYQRSLNTAPLLLTGYTALINGRTADIANAVGNNSLETHPWADNGVSGLMHLSV